MCTYTCVSEGGKTTLGNKNISKEVLQAVNKKTGKHISPQQIQKLASGVKPSTVKNERQLRKLIKEVGAVAGVPVPESTVKEIVKSVKKSGVNPNNLEQMMKSIMKK